MAKPEWGIKRHCFACGTKFYDLHRSPITCPKCSTTIDPEALFKARRSKSPVADNTALPIAAIGGLERDVLMEDPLEVDLENEGDEAPIMEDADDLGESDDMAEVIEHIEEDEEH